MGFRDETESLRGRIRELEEELRAVRAERDDAASERDRVAESLRERESGVLAAKAAARAQVRSERLGTLARALGGVLLVIAVVVGAIFAAQSACTSCSTGCAATDGLDRRAAPSAGMLDVDATPDPAALTLVASGDRSTPSGCWGYVPDAPQIVIRSAHRIALRIAPAATNGGDLVAVVLGSDGRVLCDDDSGGSYNPLVVGIVPPGDTRVWVGTYSDGNTLPFRLAVHADRADPPAGSPAAPVLAGPGPDAHGTYSGAVTAFEAASAYEPACRGSLSPDAALTLRLSEPAAVRLDATGSDDLVLFVRESDHHVKCDDDSGPGFSPRIASILPAGDHLVYVGTYSNLGRAAAYTLVADVIRVDPLAAPTLGTRALAAPGDAASVPGRSSGVLSPTSLGASCTGGLVPAAPQLELELGTESDLVLSLASEAQPFVLVAHPDRTFECLTTGHARVVFSPGPHRIYVGVADDSVEAEFTLTARVETPTLRPWVE